MVCNLTVAYSVHGGVQGPMTAEEFAKRGHSFVLPLGEHTAARTGDRKPQLQLAERISISHPIATAAATGEEIKAEPPPQAPTSQERRREPREFARTD